MPWPLKIDGQYDKLPSIFAPILPFLSQISILSIKKGSQQKPEFRDTNTSVRYSINCPKKKRYTGFGNTGFAFPGRDVMIPIVCTHDDSLSMCVSPCGRRFGFDGSLAASFLALVSVCSLLRSACLCVHVCMYVWWLVV